MFDRDIYTQRTFFFFLSRESKSFSRVSCIFFIKTQKKFKNNCLKKNKRQKSIYSMSYNYFEAQLTTACELYILSTNERALIALKIRHHTRECVRESRGNLRSRAVSPRLPYYYTISSI